ncbi:RibD family protein [Microlunatus phosphovorus]|uniref:RibD family protein n=1 Tax=Microlunatus phosphovorus TaxID=29405 RepID=UPI001E5A1E8D|nr:RibD family protein [Microlunatus phosphovorus]
MAVSARPAERPYTLLSCCISLDGYLDGASGPRWVLSGAADLDRVDALRAGCDAILVGAGTIRRDDPRLLVRDQERIGERLARGLSASPIKVTLSSSGELPPEAAFFRAGDGLKLVYCPTATADRLRTQCDGRATLVEVGERVDVRRLSEDLYARGVRRLMVEGGGSVLTQFLVGDLADELQLAVAPVFVGDHRAPRFVGEGDFPWGPDRRARLVEARPVGDVVLHRYALSGRYGLP